MAAAAQIDPPSDLEISLCKHLYKDIKYSSSLQLCKCVIKELTNYQVTKIHI